MKEALAAFNRALELEPTEPRAWVGKGDALRLLGRVREAEAAERRARELGYEG